MKQIVILGRLHKLAIAELSARLDGKIQPLKPGFVALEEPLKNPDSFGSIVRLAEPIATMKRFDWREMLDTTERHILKTPAEESGKVKLAINTGPINMPYKKQQADMLSLKKRLRSAGYSIRIIMPKNGSINAAQVKANKLASPGNYEITPVETKDGVIIARTTWCQDVDAYSARDYDRPMRDGFVGMLPPKLTQTMLNLSGVPANEDTRILDPFCGTGVVLQEALLMGYRVYGTDLAEKMVEYSEGNLTWLRETHTNLAMSLVEKGDARSHKWRGNLDAVICETYLGEPQKSIPSDAHIKQLRRESANLLSDFLTNLHQQLKPGTPVVLAIPAWKTQNGDFIDSPVVDSINRLGYTRTSLEHVSHKDLIYFRPDQFVARRILVLKRQ